jgi:oxidase EvaA
MTQAPVRRAWHDDDEIAARLTESARTDRSAFMSTVEFHRWWAGRRAANRFEVSRLPFDALDTWYFEDGTGDLVHRSGRFFRIEGLRARSTYGAVSEWTQPIINQPEIGVLGILLKEFDGVLHCLMQAKMEPGNINTLQLSPTVQATRSNYLRVHGGTPVRYLEYFVGERRGRVLADTLQSEQGSWFYRKHNRNMVVETDADVPLHEDFCWLTVGQVLDLLASENLVNMDTRTVLSCLRFAAPRDGAADYLDPAAGARHTLTDVISWFTDAKARHEVAEQRIPLSEVEGWRRTEDVIEHEDGRHFRVIAAEVSAPNREVRAWRQPLVEPCGHGLAALLLKNFGGVPHALMHARVEPGFIDGVELAPTVQCLPANYRDLPADRQPRYLDTVLTAEPARVLFDTMMSEEGGRFYDAQNRYLILDADGLDAEGLDAVAESPDYRWVAVHQLMALVRHSHYLSVQARGLIACLHRLWARRTDGRGSHA